MPRLYLDVDIFLSTPEALTFPAQVAMLQARSGALDMLLAQASRRVDSYCKKRIVSPPMTVIGAGGISAGGTSLPVLATLGFDNGQEQAVIIGSGGTQEIIPVFPGGIQVSSWTSPYPGTLKLASPALYSHSAGETVQGLYQEVSTVGSSSSSEPYSGDALELSQDAQLAYAHNGAYMDSNNLVRIIFLKQYPIVQLYRLEHQLPFATGQYSNVGIQDIGINAASGYIRLPIGSYVLESGLMRTTYIAGFQNIPDEIAQATALYAADALQKMMSSGAAQMQQGKLRGVYRNTGQQYSNYVQDAQTLLNDGNYVRRI